MCQVDPHILVASDMQSRRKKKKNWKEFPFGILPEEIFFALSQLLINNICTFTFTFSQFVLLVAAVCSLLIAWETSHRLLANAGTENRSPQCQVSGSLNTTLFFCAYSHNNKSLAEKLLQCCHNVLIESLNYRVPACK